MGANPLPQPGFGTLGANLRVERADSYGDPRDVTFANHFSEGPLYGHL